MRENYLAWSVDVADFEKLETEVEKVKFLINFAVLAPSSHNSQPWEFKIKNENTISVFINPARRLPQSDVNNRQLYISLGCAITNILVAADYYGYSSEVHLLPESTESELVAEINFKKKSARRVSDHLIFSIAQRTNNRNKYEMRLPPSEFLREITQLETADIEIKIVSDQREKDELADAVLTAGEIAMEDKKFRQELSGYVKSNITKEKTGMPGFGLGIPTPPSLLASLMVRFLNMNRLTRKKDEKLLKIHTPLFVVICTKNDNPLNWLKAGEIYQRIALIATRQKLQTAVWAAAIQIGSYYQVLQKILNTTLRPQVFFRLGYTNRVPAHSPRITAQEVTK